VSTDYAPRTTQYDFANILFAGPCNARCPFCIGRQIDPRLSVNNLREFPPRNLDRFIEMIAAHAIKQVVFTGTTTDPQLYQHEARLLERLRQRLPGDTRYSLHTNGRLALQKPDTFNLYDRVCISFPTFNPDTYCKMMGVRGVPDLAQIVDRAQIPVKVSCVVNADNRPELPDFLDRCQAIGMRRLVIRRLYGEIHALPVVAGLSWRGSYAGNPVYDYRGMEVTYWNFDRCDCQSINLFSNGTISADYLLTSAYPTQRESQPNVAPDVLRSV
jgi:pyruvate-formate lyase-activating enzyme